MKVLTNPSRYGAALHAKAINEAHLHGHPKLARCRRTNRKTAAATAASIQSLERRTLLSAAWTTVDDFLPPPQGAGSYAHAEDMASDGAGGVYAAGYAYDPSAPPGSAYIRHKDAGSSMWQTVATVQSPTGSLYSARFEEMAVAPTGEVYLSGMVGGGNSYSMVIWKGSLNAEGTDLSLSVVESQPVSANPALVYTKDLAVDAAGNVFAIGTLTGKGGPIGTAHWIVRKQTAGEGPFVTVDDFLFNKSDAAPSGIAVVGGSVYVVGKGGNRWLVRKSANAGGSWTTVDSFTSDSSTNAPAAAAAIVGHEDGTVHVVGSVSSAVRTGGNTKNPTYRYDSRWYMRSSSNGGSTWVNDDVYPENVGVGTVVSPAAVTTDQSGKVYVAGTVNKDTVNSRSVVRTNANGAWSTSDDYHAVGGGYTRAYSMTRDSSGTVYVGGEAASHWSIRSMTPAAPAIFASAAIIGDSSTTTDADLIDLLA